MYIDNLVLEITRRCNMKCLHCMRGESENRTISDKTLDRLFFRLRDERIGTLTITGGEPSLAPSRIDYIVRFARMYRVEIYQFYMVTNGKRITQPFLNAVNELYSYCQCPDSCSINYSNDKFHEKGYLPGVEKLELYPFFAGGKDGREWPLDYDKLITEGRAEYLGSRELELHRYDVREDPDESGVYEGLFYVNCLGKVLPSCDLSYNSQSHPNLILGSVFDQDFNLVEYARRFNQRLDWMGYSESMVGRNHPAVSEMKEATFTQEVS